jgi:HK97 family phage major capsid protein
MTPAVATTRVSALPSGTAFARYLQAKALGHGSLGTELEIAKRWTDTPQVFEALQLQTKAAVPAGSTTDATWAGPLSAYNIAGEALTIMRGMSILGALEPRMQRTPLHTRVARETGTGITGGWVAPGAAVPVQATTFATVVEEHYKYGVIVPLSEELMRLSNPDAEATIRRTVLGGLSAAIDNQFLLPTVAAVTNTNPASITNGATAITTTGTTAAQITTDLSGMMAAMTTPGPYVWIMKPTTMYKIAATLGSSVTGLPRTLFGIPVIASVNSPAQITLLDPAAILYSDSGQFDVETSTEAALQFNTAPAEPTTASTVFQSLFQANLIAIKALRWLAWLRPASGSVVYMTVSY